jgi:hypothetical protein
VYGTDTLVLRDIGLLVVQLVVYGTDTLVDFDVFVETAVSQVEVRVVDTNVVVLMTPSVVE